jgi:hypothetical protein
LLSNIALKQTGIPPIPSKPRNNKMNKNVSIVKCENCKNLERKDAMKVCYNCYLHEGEPERFRECEKCKELKTLTPSDIT